MRLPWEQLTMEVIEVTAPELADKLFPELPPELEEGLSKALDALHIDKAFMLRAVAGWGIVESFKWALARCPDKEPPSANAVVKGPTAARQIARTAGWRGAPTEYVEAAAGLAYPTLERVSDGVRFRGLDRYDVSWGDRNKEAWRAWKAAHPEKRSLETSGQPPAEVRRNSAGDPSDLRRPDTDADPDADTPPPPPRLVVVGKPPQITVADLTPAQRAKWDLIQRGRSAKKLLKETAPPDAFPAWSDELDAQGVVAEQVDHALALYLRDDHWRDRYWPAALFIAPKVFRARLPQPPEEIPCG